MKFLALMICCFFWVNVNAQNIAKSKMENIKITENSIVKDSTGNVYAFNTWKALLATGRYALKAENTRDKNTQFLIIRLSDEAFERKLKNLPKPPESNSFKTGAAFYPLKARDINNEKINTKKLAGKILVINFWFVNCPPCVMEIPELNKIVDEYKNDSNIVFLAVALDKSTDLEEFLSNHPFKYTIIDDGRFITTNYKITSYPTNIVISPEGKIHFSSSGYSGISTTNWIKKSIEELKKTAAAETISSQ